MKNKLISTCGVLLILALTLTACNLGNMASTSSTQAANTAYTGSATTAPTEASAAPGACLVGTWNLFDFSAYMASIGQNMSANSGHEITITSGGFSGVANFVFNVDNSTTFNADNFQQNFTMSYVVNDQTLDIPISLTVNGTSSAEYSVDGDRISFSNQTPGDIVITMETNGTVSTLDQSLLGQPGTIQLYQFSCVDANTLSLKVVAVNNMDLAPFTLTRAQ